MSVITPNAIEVKVHLYHSGERRIVVTCPNRSLIHPLAFEYAKHHAFATFPHTSRSFLRWCIGRIERTVDDVEEYAASVISIDDMRAILEYANEQLGCTHPSGSVEVDDSDCQLSSHNHLLEKMRVACNSVQMDYTAEDNKSVMDCVSVTKLTVANLMLIADTAMDLKRLAEATVANRETETGTVIDLEG